MTSKSGEENNKTMMLGLLHCLIIEFLTHIKNLPCDLASQDKRSESVQQKLNKGDADSDSISEDPLLFVTWLSVV